MEEKIKIQRAETEENRKQRYCDYERALKQLRKMKQQEEKQHARGRIGKISNRGACPIRTRSC